MAADRAAGLPREVAYVLLAAPCITQFVANPDVFTETPQRVLLEIAGNYVPAVAILAGLVGWFRIAPPRDLTRPVPLVLACALITAMMSVVARPFHELVIGDDFPAMGVYLQRNVGLTCLIVWPALLLHVHRARAHAAERHGFEQQRAALEAEVEALQSRIQPHFLFNVLNTIASLVRDDVELAERTLGRLAAILRYAQEGARMDRVELEREVGIVSDYLEVQRARFGSRLHYEMVVQGGAGRALVVPFVLQPLVENAVLHAVAGRVSGGCLCITAERRDLVLVLRVEDDGPGPGASLHRGSRTSLGDLERRLALLHGPDSSLVTYENVRGGFTAEVHVPFATEAA